MAVATEEMPISPTRRRAAADLAHAIAVVSCCASRGREFHDMRHAARSLRSLPIENDHDAGEWQDWPPDENTD
jgi:hypothetical protein